MGFVSVRCCKKQGFGQKNDDFSQCGIPNGATWNLLEISLRTDGKNLKHAQKCADNKTPRFHPN